MRLNLVLFLSTFYLLIFFPLKFRFSKVKLLLEATFFISIFTYLRCQSKMAMEY